MSRLHFIKLAVALAVVAVASTFTAADHSEQGDAEPFGGTGYTNPAPPPPTPERLEASTHAWATTLGAPAYTIARDSELADGVALNLRTGDVAIAGDMLAFGPWWIMTDATILMNAGDSGPWAYIDFEVGELLATHDTFDLAAPDRKSCRVRCRSGFFACCRWIDGVARCKCVRNGESDELCSSGGEGADECGIGAGSLDWN